MDFKLGEILQFLRVNQELSEMPGGGVNAVVGYIEKHPGHRANFIAKSLGLPLRSVQRYLSRLKSSEKLNFVAHHAKEVIISLDFKDNLQKGYYV